MFKRLRIFIFDYWHYLLFGIFALVVILSVVYFNQNIYEERHKRLMSVHAGEVILYDEIDPPAGPDQLVGGFLLPPMSVYLPLPEDWPIREDWGDPVTVREQRIPGMILQGAPPRIGPDGAP